MKKIVFVVFFIMLGIVFFLRHKPAETIISSATRHLTAPITSPPVPALTNASEAIFVPYWVVNGKKIDVSEFATVIYFGITANTSGVDTTDDGYAYLSKFNNALPKNTPTLLTLRLLNVDTNFSILDKKELQQKIINQTISVAKEHDFSGVILDLELNALPFDSVISNITNFNKSFAQAARSQNLSFATTVYGDTFYRFRPYNVSEIAKQVDQVYVMAYDFSKARGNPGPNFPFGGKEVYGYDFQTMTSDFLAAVPKEKLVITLGRFGYDWQVDEKGKGEGMATSLSEYKIQQQFVSSCSQAQCQSERDEKSGEPFISYVDKSAKKHTIWYEDEKSVVQKTDFLKEKGVSRVGFWAYSYF